MAINISLYNYDFINNISLYAVITSHLAGGDFNTLKGIFLGKAGINNSIRLVSSVNKCTSETNSINKSRDQK
jgi:hypothetical protein